MRGTTSLNASSAVTFLVDSIEYARTGDIDSKSLDTLLEMATELVTALTHRQKSQPWPLDALAPSPFALLPTATELGLILSSMACADVACLALSAKTLRAALPNAVQSFWKLVPERSATHLLSDFLCSPARVQWAVDNGVTDVCDACGACAMSGRLDLLQLVYAAGAHAKWGRETMVRAAAHGHLDIVQWLVQHGCPWDSCVIWHPFEYVARQPNAPPMPPPPVIDCLRWAVLHGTTAPNSAFDRDIPCSSPDSAFLQALRCPETLPVAETLLRAQEEAVARMRQAQMDLPLNQYGCRTSLWPFWRSVAHADDAFANAGEIGGLAVLQWVHAHIGAGAPGGFIGACHRAGFEGLGILQLQELQRSCYESAAAGAAKVGNWAVLHWLNGSAEEIQGVLSARNVGKAAAVGNQLEVLQWLRQLTLDWAQPLVLDAETCAAAACALPVLQWLRRLDVPWDATTAEATLRHGYTGTRLTTGHNSNIEDVPADGFAAFEWALAHGVPLSEMCCAIAAENNDRASVHALVERGAPLGPDVMAAAAESGHCEMLAYLHDELYCACDEETFYCTADQSGGQTLGEADVRADMAELADMGSHGHFAPRVKCLTWALKNGIPYRDGDARNLLLALVANGWIKDNPEETVKHPLRIPN